MKLSLALWICAVFSVSLSCDAKAQSQALKVTNNCEVNVSRLDNLNRQISSIGATIIIARLGSKEFNRELNVRRLHNIRLYLVEHWDRSPNKIVLAQGERVSGNGRLEVYISGVLTETFLLPSGEDFLAGSCDGTSKTDKLFFKSHKWKRK